MIKRQFINQKMKEFLIQNYLKEQLGRTGNSHTEIKRTPLGEKVVVYTTHPGLVVGYKTLQSIINAGALGAEIKISGKLPSKRAKSWRFSAGYLKKSGDISENFVKKCIGAAKLKAGTIGVQVSIMTPDIVLPDRI